MCLYTLHLHQCPHCHHPHPSTALTFHYHPCQPNLAPNTRRACDVFKMALCNRCFSGPSDRAPDADCDGRGNLHGGLHAIAEECERAREGRFDGGLWGALVRMLGGGRA